MFANDIPLSNQSLIECYADNHSWALIQYWLERHLFFWCYHFGNFPTKKIWTYAHLCWAWKKNMTLTRSEIILQLLDHIIEIFSGKRKSKILSHVFEIDHSNLRFEISFQYQCVGNELHSSIYFINCVHLDFFLFDYRHFLNCWHNAIMAEHFWFQPSVFFAS